LPESLALKRCRSFVMVLEISSDFLARKKEAWATNFWRWLT